jgi:hypothetical protein
VSTWEQRHDRSSLRAHCRVRSLGSPMSCSTHTHTHTHIHTNEGLKERLEERGRGRGRGRQRERESARARARERESTRCAGDTGGYRVLAAAMASM